MSELLTSNDQVAALFYKGDSLLIPPFEIAKERRSDNETYERTFYRLCARQGITGYADAYSRFVIHDQDGQPIRGRIMQPRNGELDNATIDYLIPFSQVEEYLEQGNGTAFTSSIDKKLALTALAMLQKR